MSEAKGTHKNETVYICQIKNKEDHVYRDSFTSKTLGTDLDGLKDYINRMNMDNLDWRFIKRTIKEDLV